MTTHAATLDQQALDQLLAPYLPSAPIVYGAVDYDATHVPAVIDMIIDNPSWDALAAPTHWSVWVPVGGRTILVRVARS